MMRNTCILRISLVVLLAGLAAGVQASNPNDLPPVFDDSVQVPASFEADQQKAYTSPMLVPAAAFHSDGSDPDSHSFYFNVGFIGSDNDGTSTCMYAPINLPDGAHVTDFYSNLMDNNASLEMSVYLLRVDKDTGWASEMASVTSTGADTNIDSLWTNSITDPDIDWHYAYFVTTCIHDDFRIYNARVYYTEP